LSDYYVYTGSTNGTGSAASPFTWDYFWASVNPTLAPGDTAWFQDGTYTMTAQLSLNRSGTGTAGTYTSTAPVTYRAVNARMAHFQGPSYAAGPPVDQGTIWHGLNVTASDVQLIGLKISRIPYNGIVVSGTRVRIENCQVFRCGKQRTTTSDGGQNIHLSNSAQYTTVTGCWTYEAKEHGIYNAGADFSLIEDTIIELNAYDYLNQPTEKIVGSAGASGLQFNDAASTCTVTGCTIRYNTRVGISVLSAVGLTLTNNVIYGNVADQLQLSTGAGTVVCTGNHIATDQRSCILTQGSSRVSLFSNLLWAETGLGAMIPVEYTAPVNVTSTSTNRFHTPTTNVGRDQPSAMVPFATWQFVFTDTTSTKTTAVDTAGLDADIIAWIGGGGGTGTPGALDVEPEPEPEETFITNAFAAELQPDRIQSDFRVVSI
jgi:parallel beta-helix repeat protein